MKKYLSVVLMFFVGAPVTMAAENFEYEFRIGATQSDNVRRTALAPVEDTFLFAGLDLDLLHNTKTFEIDILTNIEYQSYEDDSFDDDVLGAASGSLVVNLVPDAFTWHLKANFGQIQANPFAAATPDSRENINTMSTGPDLQIRFGRATALGIGAYYVTNDFELRNSDNEVLGAKVGLIRSLSSKRSISLNVSSDRIEFDDPVMNRNYDRQTAHLGFSSEMSRGSLSISAGVNEIQDDGESADGFFGGFSFSRQLSPRSDLVFSYDQRLSDAGDIFSRYQERGQEFGDVRDISGTSDPFENRRFRLGFDSNRDNSSWFASIDVNESEYVNDSALDQRRTGVRIGTSRRFGSGWGIGLEISAYRNEFENVDREDEYLDARFELERQLTRTVSLAVGYQYSDRSSTDLGQDYEENRYTLLVRLGPGR